MFFLLIYRVNKKVCHYIFEENTLKTARQEIEDKLRKTDSQFWLMSAFASSSEIKEIF